MKQITVREIGGQILSEFCVERQKPDSVLSEITFEQETAFGDLMMSILARHDNCILINDRDLPVEPRPIPEWPDNLA